MATTGVSKVARLFNLFALMIAGHKVIGSNVYELLRR